MLYYIFAEITDYGMVQDDFQIVENQWSTKMNLSLIFVFICFKYQSYFSFPNFAVV